VAMAELLKSGARYVVKLAPVKAEFEHERDVLYDLCRSTAASFVVKIENDFEASEKGKPSLLALELLYKSLPDFLGAPKDQAVLQGLAKNICLAVAALHAAGYAHLDFKPHQVCLAVADDTKVKLVDFDAARRPGEPCSTTLTYMYAPPERFRDPAGRASFKMDVFSLGLVLAYLLSPRHDPVFLHDDDARARLLGSAAPLVPDHVYARFAHAEVVALLKELLQEDPSLRPDMAVVAKKPIVVTGAFSAVGQVASQADLADVLVNAIGAAAEAARPL
jgi:serine/threonine protein kinase